MCAKKRDCQSNQMEIWKAMNQDKEDKWRRSEIGKLSDRKVT